MKRPVFIALAVLSLIAGHPLASTSIASSSEESPQDKMEQFITNGQEFKVGRSQAKIISNLGQPTSIVVEKIERQGSYVPRSPEDFPPDETIDLFYDGLQIRVFHAALENEELLQYLSITDAKYKVRWGLGVGCARSAVKAALGAPTEAGESTATYQSRHNESFVQFYFKNDVIYRIDWWYYTD